jgi:hypothetical protein
MSGRITRTPARTVGLKPSVKAAPAIADAMIPNMIKKKPYIPDRVGARNPYALAERIYALQHPDENPLVWEDDPGAWESNRSQLMGILNDIPRLKTITYEQLFDPSLKKFSPLYSSPFIIHLHNIKKPRVLAVPDPLKVRTAAQPCSDTGTHWATPAGCYNYRQIVRTQADVIDDVVQGCTKNCYFMAALASNAWTKFGNFPLDRASALKPEYTIPFFNGPNGDKTITVDTTLVLDAANKPVFARPSAKAEIWPEIYEKAYGVFWPPCKPSSLPYTGNYPNHPRPHMPDFPFGDPLAALEHLTGSSFANSYFNTVNNKGSCFTLMESTAIRYNGTSGTTLYPMVAYSYYDAATANTANGTTWITYDNETIVANHSYSILGTVKSDPEHLLNPETWFIVLRNPYGRLWGADPTAFPAGALYLGSWSPTANFSRTLSYGLDGVFALRADLFECYFKRFGWVQ